jgi:hypothetical protein
MRWEPVALSEVRDSDPRLPTLGASGLVYPGGRHIFSGEPESGKTIAAYAIALETLREGEPNGTKGTWVALVDFEMSTQLARQRFLELGANEQELAAIFYYAPDDPPTDEDWNGILEEPPPALLIYDAFAGAAALLGLDDHRGKEIERFAATFIRPAWESDVATIVLDHVTKSREGRGRWPVGSERKVGGADVVLGFEAVKRLSRGGDSLVKVTTHKDRFGYLPRPRAANLELRSDPTTHAITWTWQQATDTDETGEWMPTRLMEKVSRYLEIRPDGANRTAIYRDVEGKRDYLIVSVSKLIEHRFAEETVPGAKGTAIRSLKPFRAEPSPTSPVVPDGSRNGRHPTVPSVPTPYRGDGDGDDHEQDELDRLQAIADELERA